MRYTNLNNSSINPGSGNYPGLFLDNEAYGKLQESAQKANMPFTPSGIFQLEKERTAFSIPESLSNARNGYEQQTFLGASIRNFSISAGFGDSASTMSIDLVEDEYNKSDSTPLGSGVDSYHNGQRDIFSPPFTGSPVYFNFGKTRASINDSFVKVYDDLYGFNNRVLGENGAKPKDYPKFLEYEEATKAQFHFNFGGILQSFVQNRGPGGNPLYSAQIVDPREVLSNVVLILNNYTGTTYNTKNMYNIYGFLEYNPTTGLKEKLQKQYKYKSVLRKNINLQDGTYNFVGYDLFARHEDSLTNYGMYNKNYVYQDNEEGNFPELLPITGTGFARRGPQGIPFYRLAHGLNSLMGIYGKLPNEYINAGFGGWVNFRGYNYILDLSGLASVPDYYFFDYDQINVLDLCLEICDITSSELFVSLLPIIENHVVCQRFDEWNKLKILEGKPQDVISGIIKVTSIDKSFQPEYGAIKKYIDGLASANVYVENQDVGYELSNVVTDKFVAGAQEVDMYFFSSNSDRDTIEVKKQQTGTSNRASALLMNQWTLEESLSQQILPFYGFLDKGVVSIPKGFGSYQQILIDSSSWGINGIGNYYVATEMELRCALISYERWSEFLLRYNDLYMESFETNDAIEGAALQGSLPGNAPEFLPSISNNFAVTVPRSVFTSDNNNYGADGLPVSTCNPPYGYPLYYKRATKLGVQGAGLSDLRGTTNRILTNLASLRGDVDKGPAKFNQTLNSQWTAFNQDNVGLHLSGMELEYFTFLSYLMQNMQSGQDVIGLIDSYANGLAPSVSVQDRLSRKVAENSFKAYNMIKNIAEENLGKRFLVKIPKEVNMLYDPEVKIKQHLRDIQPLQPALLNADPDLFIGEYLSGPFGFPPRSINHSIEYMNSPEYKFIFESMQGIISSLDLSMMKSFLTAYEPNPKYFQGALNVNFNPITETHEFNYIPDKQGGYINFDLFSNITGVAVKQNLAIWHGLVPQDATNFINDGNRLSAYVRYDHSEDLAFDQLSTDSFSQQFIVANNFIPDVSDVLDNTKTDENNFQRFPDAQSMMSSPKRPPSIAFVKCDVDEDLYLIPPIEVQNITIHGREVKDIGQYSFPTKVRNELTCQNETAFRYYEPHFVPVKPNNDFKVSRLDFVRYNNGLGSIVTKKDLLNQDHVYALITLPGRIIPIQDSRFRDGLFQEKNGQYLKHFLAMDVVKLPEFSAPAYLGRPDTTILRDFRRSLDPNMIGSAVQAFQASLDRLNFAFPNQIDTIMPSPVYPDLVALPLQSKDRCYGPWVSSTFSNNASNIGGRIEFIKDENLAPWSYNGYDLMNQAGMLQAEMSNSLLLSAERGGFVVPQAPSGIAIGSFLLDAGPLVTNISVDVSDQGIKSTFKMDLYTASFGKLQKQKQDLISNISRERQKLKDEKNALIRKGLGKSQKSTNYNLIYQQLKNMQVLPFQMYESVYGNRPSNNSIVGSSTTSNANSAVPAPRPTSTDFFGYNGYTDVGNKINYSSSINDMGTVLEFGSNYPDILSLSKSYNDTGASQVSDLFIVASKDLGHATMSHMEDGFLESKADIYSQIDGYDNKDLTGYT